MIHLVQYHIAKPGMPLPPIQAPLYEYIMAGNGIFIRGARREFQAQFRIAPGVVNGLQDLQPSFELNGSRVRGEIVLEMLDRARAARDAQGQPVEILFHLELDDLGVWRLRVPDQTQAPASTKPTDDSTGSSYARACIDVHSHVHMPARFSSLDDRDEMGCRLYVVLGRIHEAPEIRLRVGLYGYRHEFPAAWVFELPPGITDTVPSEDIRTLETLRQA